MVVMKKTAAKKKDYSAVLYFCIILDYFLLRSIFSPLNSIESVQLISQGDK